MKFVILFFAGLWLVILPGEAEEVCYKTPVGLKKTFSRNMTAAPQGTSMMEVELIEASEANRVIVLSTIHMAALANRSSMSNEEMEILIENGKIEDAIRSINEVESSLDYQEVISETINRNLYKFDGEIWTVTVQSVKNPLDSLNPNSITNQEASPLVLETSSPHCMVEGHLTQVIDNTVNSSRTVSETKLIGLYMIATPAGEFEVSKFEVMSTTEVNYSGQLHVVKMHRVYFINEELGAIRTEETMISPDGLKDSSSISVKELLNFEFLE